MARLLVMDIRIGWHRNCSDGAHKLAIQLDGEALKFCRASRKCAKEMVRGMETLVVVVDFLT